jgi:hypothetical protein
VKQRTFLLAADMMYASSNMDGKFKLLSLPAILDPKLINQQKHTQNKSIIN